MDWALYINLFNIAMGGANIGLALVNKSWWGGLLGIAVLCWGLAYVLGAVR